MNKEEKSSNKCPICGRPTHKKSKYCIFHASAEEKTEEEFKKALKEYIQEIKEEDKEYNFKGSIFIGDIDFKKDLSVATFKKANFNQVTFKGVISFENVTFKESTKFDCVNFERSTFFNFSIFKKNIDFSRATFEDSADFCSVTFEGEADFSDVIFKKHTFFSLSVFKKNADFSYATFKDYICFDYATFKGHINFIDTIFPSGRELCIIVEKKGIIDFRSAFLENVILELYIDDGVLIDFTHTLIKNTKIKKDQIEKNILQEKKKEFFEAKDIYLLLKNNFHSIGRYDDESWAFIKEKEMERRSYSIESFTKNVGSEEEKSEGKIPKEKKLKIISYFNWFKTKKFRKWLWSCFCNIIYGYGERPQNVIFSAIFIIILFSVFFSFLGINSPEIIEMKSPTVQEIFNGNSEIISKGSLINKATNNSIDCLYFSAITFTTLGYGDFRPLEGWGRILAGTEAFIGAFMMALFVYTFARRTGGR